jgi:hypothetical protein
VLLKREKVTIMLTAWHFLFGFIDQVKDQRNNDAYQYAGCDRQKHLEITFVNHNVARQSARKGKLRSKVHDETRNKKDKPGDDQKFSHLQNY